MSNAAEHALPGRPVLRRGDVARFRDNPYPHYERFRGPGPLLRVADTIWFAWAMPTSPLLRHPGRRPTNPGHHRDRPVGPGRGEIAEPALHGPARSHAAAQPRRRAFTPRRIDGLRAATEAITAKLLDGLATHREPVDLIEAFAYPLPVRVICTLLGVPAADEATFTGWSRGIARSLDPRSCARPRSTPPSSRPGAKSAPISAIFSRAVAGLRATTFCPAWPPSTPTAIASPRAKCCP